MFADGGSGGWKGHFLRGEEFCYGSDRLLVGKVLMDCRVSIALFRQNLQSISVLRMTSYSAFAKYIRELMSKAFVMVCNGCGTKLDEEWNLGSVEIMLHARRTFTFR